MAIVLFVALGAFTVIAYLISRIGSRCRGLPPGPSTVPLFGNALQIPTHHTYLKLTEWAKTYGGIYSLKVGPDTMIVLTDRRYIKQLLDKKSSIYSGRPAFYIGQFVGGGDHILFMGNDHKWRVLRKVFHNYLKESMVMDKHLKIVDAEAVHMCYDFLTAPKDFLRHSKRYSYSVASTLAYGLRTTSTDTPHMARLNTIMDVWTGLLELGSTPPIDQVPLLKYLPDMLFGNWKSRARNVRKELNEIFSEDLEMVVNRRRGERGVNKGSFADSILDQEQSLGFDRHQLYFAAGNFMEAASDTTAATINNFIRAMMKWPEVMQKAQREIDSVVGEDRSPTFNDYTNLPYLAATMKETMRWRPSAPLGIFHAVSEDDYIDGFFIPKGAIILQNIWGLHHDETYFTSPETFNPDRYYGITQLAPELAAVTDYRDRDHYAYGAGRRLCPGIHLAERGIYLAIAKLLWAFEFIPGGEEAVDVDVERACYPGVVLKTRHYRCVVEVRSERRREAILRELELAKKGVFADYE